jgi:hypothetical protein
MLDQQLCLESVGMVKVDLRTFVRGEVCQFAIVRVVGQVGYLFCAHLVKNGSGYRCLAGAGASRDAKDHR